MESQLQQGDTLRNLPRFDAPIYLAVSLPLSPLSSVRAKPAGWNLRGEAGPDSLPSSTMPTLL